MDISIVYCKAHSQLQLRHVFCLKVTIIQSCGLIADFSVSSWFHSYLNSLSVPCSKSDYSFLSQHSNDQSCHNCKTCFSIIPSLLQCSADC